MPYHIEPYKDGYRVISVSGRPLSKKPLSLKKAEEQKTAVNISEHIEEKINPKFKKQLKKIGIQPRTYLSKARRMAKKFGYNDTLTFSDDDIHKLKIKDPDGTIRKFGRVGYGDFILWSFLEKKGEVEKGYSRMKRNVFQKSHGALSEQRDIDDPYAPNNLALKILW